MKPNQNIEAMLYNIELAEKTHPVKMTPIYKIFMDGDPRMFLRSVYDYVWFDDFDIPYKQFEVTGTYAHYMERIGEWKNDSPTR